MYNLDTRNILRLDESSGLTSLTLPFASLRGLYDPLRLLYTAPDSSM